MTKAGYTHVLIPTSLHSVLRDKAKEQEISIGKYIQNLMERAESPAWKACGALPRVSSNLTLGVAVFDGDCIENKFDKFLRVQKILSSGTVGNHIRRCSDISPRFLNLSSPPSI